MLLAQCILFIHIYFTSGDLKVNLSNLHVGHGQLLVAIYASADAYMQTEKALVLKSVLVNDNQPLELVFPGLKQGNYAVTVVHDLNKNGNIDANIFGVPTEPYGFSNNVRPKFRSASWKEANFYLSSGKTSIEIKLDTW